MPGQSGGWSKNEELKQAPTPNKGKTVQEDDPQASYIQNNFSKINPYNIIGLPPSIYYEPHLLQTVTMASMPIMAIYPAYPAFGSKDKEKVGLQLYHLDPKSGLEKYNKLLDGAGVPKLEGNCLYAAFLNDAAISESFSVEYGESMFESAGNTASNTLAELKFITGKENIEEIGGSVKEELKKSGLFGSMAGGLVGMGGALGGVLQDLANVVPGMGKILTGSKIDFPMIWKGAGFSSSYSMTIRLYNPSPRNDQLHKETIIWPLSKLIALCMPISDSESTFTFPVVASVSCPGLFKLKAAYISSLEVTKGGDAQDISYIQRPGIVDVRITFSELYGTMVGESGYKIKDQFRPTFKEYIQQLESKATVGNIFEEKLDVTNQMRRTKQSPSSRKATASSETPTSRVNNSDKTKHASVS